MRISDWSSDVCSSDLTGIRRSKRFPTRAPSAPQSFSWSLPPARLPRSPETTSSTDSHAAKDNIDMTTPKAVHFLEGMWLEGNPPIMGPMTHAAWMAQVDLEVARSFEGVTLEPD